MKCLNFFSYFFWCKGGGRAIVKIVDFGVKQLDWNFDLIIYELMDRE